MFFCSLGVLHVFASGATEVKKKCWVEAGIPSFIEVNDWSTCKQSGVGLPANCILCIESWGRYLSARITSIECLSVCRCNILHPLWNFGLFEQVNCEKMFALLFFGGFVPSTSFPPNSTEATTRSIASRKARSASRNGCRSVERRLR